jgi:hypothetical protein
MATTTPVIPSSPWSRQGVHPTIDFFKHLLKPGAFYILFCCFVNVLAFMFGYHKKIGFSKLALRSEESVTSFSVSGTFFSHRLQPPTW